MTSVILDDVLEVVHESGTVVRLHIYSYNYHSTLLVFAIIMCCSIDRKSGKSPSACTDLAMPLLPALGLTCHNYVLGAVWSQLQSHEELLHVHVLLHSMFAGAL